MEKDIRAEAARQYFKYFKIWFVIVGILAVIAGVVFAVHLLGTKSQRSNTQAPVERVYDYADVLTAEERKQLDSALRMENSEGLCEDDDHGVSECHENGVEGVCENGDSNNAAKGKKSWFGWNKKGTKNVVDDPDNPKMTKKYSKQ